MSMSHEDLQDLLGAFALDALELSEREELELHLLECPRCRAEVAEHREVAAFLSQSGADAPDGVWDRIARELAPAAPPLRLAVEPTPAPAGAERGEATVTPIAAARRSVRYRTMAAIVAAAAVIVAVVGFIAVDQSRRLNRLEDAMTERTLEGMANDAVAGSAVEARLTGPGGKAQAVVSKDGQGYLIMDEVHQPPSGDVYQLWGKVGGTVLSLGTFGGGHAVVPFNVDPSRLDDVELFAVTQERAPGVVASTQEPLMAGPV
jgi:hypothetical protein